MNLRDLSQFTIDRIEFSPGDPEMRVVGRFSHLRGVKGDRGWLYRGQELPVIGDLETIPRAASDTVVFKTPDVELSTVLAPNQIFPWLDGYWQSYHLDMIVAPTETWRRQRFVAGPAQYFLLNGVTGWQPLDEALPVGALPTRIQDRGWDHEHCELCQQRIGAAGDEDGYVNLDDHWLCVTCYDRYAARNDISFALEA